ncbi:MAG: hypothetical protein F4Y99_09115, partial [Acidimicrobiaceae bacterium]|nr:hypothetical protein [Acidimicrobiaceae bacterium]
MQASFSSTFTTGVASGTFTTEAPPPPSVSSVEIGSITHSSATITVEVDDADGSLLYLRRRVYPSGSWSSTSKASASTTTFSLTGLSAETDYDVEVSFDSDFEDAQLQYFQTLERPEGTRGPTGPSGPTGPGPTGGGGAPPPEPEPEPEPEAPRFTDVDESSVHAADIEALYAAGITLGCPSQQGLQFCPDQPVTRAQMATFLARALNL